MTQQPNLTRAAILSADPQQLRLWCADYVMGYVAWEEKRGEYIYYIWQKPGEREPWFRSRDWEMLKKNYTPAGPYNPRIHIQPQGSLPDFPNEIGSAWLLHKAMLQKSALRHNRYLDYLKDAISARTGQRVLTWTMVIDLMEPIDICRAAVLASVGEE